MGSLGFSELFLIGIVALLAFGGERLPDAARRAGRTARQLRDLVDSARRELSEAVTEAPRKSGGPPELPPTKPAA